MEIISVGQKLANVGFTTARWIYDATEQQGLLFLRLANYGRQETELTITGTVKNQELFSRKTKLSTKSTAPIEIPIPGGVGEVRIKLSAPGDALEIENRSSVSSMRWLMQKSRPEKTLTCKSALPARNLLHPSESGGWESDR
jgi:hypothetical protein